MERVRKQHNLGYVLAIIFLGVIAFSMSVAFIISSIKLNNSSIVLENFYERSFYDLVDNLNNVEIKMSKLLVSNDKDYSKKLLTEIYEDTSDAQNNISMLPISVNGIPDTITFINKLSGYTLSLSNKLEKTEKLSNSEDKKIEELYTQVKTIKQKLNDISMQVINGYNIMNASLKNKEDYNDFTTTIQGIKATDEEYPSMIYDGPFSDSQINKEILGLNFEEKTKEECENLLREYFSSYEIKNVSFSQETNGKFVTFDYVITLQNDYTLFAQLTKKGGKLLTLTSYSDSNNTTKTLKEAQNIAEKFTNDMGLKNMECVWSSVIGNKAYINLAPIQNETIIYPDLIKVKVDLSNGIIIGYEAKTYYTNHKERELEKISFDLITAKENLSPKFKVLSSRICLAPIDYGREVLCFEFKCEYNDSEYYVYVNAQTGKEENILKVIESKTGSELL